jgi:hypothetical protein
MRVGVRRLAVYFIRNRSRMLAAARRKFAGRSPMRMAAKRLSRPPTLNNC